MSRQDSLLSAAELLSQAAASMASPHAHGLPQLAFGPGPGFDHALNSPMTPQPQVGRQEVLVAMATPIKHAHGLPQLVFGLGSGFDSALNSPMMPKPQVAAQFGMLCSGFC